MSNTDIFPPRAYSTTGGYQDTVSYDFNPIWGRTGPGYSRYGPLEISGGTEKRLSEVTSNYYFACQFGNLPMHNFSYVRMQTWALQGETRTVWNDGGWGQDVTTRGFRVTDNTTSLDLFDIDAPVQFNLGNRARLKVLEKVKDQDVNLAQVWAERDQAFRLIGDNAKRIAKSISALKKGDLAGAAGALGIKNPGSAGFSKKWQQNQARAIAQGWLSIVYGVIPLLSDIFGACEVIRKSVNKKEFVVVRSKQSIQEETVVTKVIGNGWVDNLYYSRKCDVTVVLKCKRSSYLLSAISNVGLTNPISIAWELHPYSFVVDWVLPIGKFISQIDSTVGWTFDQAAITTFLESSGILTRTPLAPYPYPIVELSGSMTKRATNIRCDRIGYAGFNDLLSLPFIKNPLSFLHASEGVSLLLAHKR